MVRIRHQTMDKLLGQGSQTPTSFSPGAAARLTRWGSFLLNSQRVHAVVTLVLILLDATQHSPPVYRRPSIEAVKVLAFLVTTFASQWDPSVYVRLLCLWTFLSGMSGLALPIKMVWSGKRQADAIALAIIATGFVGLVLMVAALVDVMTAVKRSKKTARSAA